MNIREENKRRGEKEIKTNGETFLKRFLPGKKIN